MSKDAHLFVGLDTDTYRAGDKVTGVVVLHIVDKSLRLDRLNVRIVGREHVCWHEFSLDSGGAERRSSRVFYDQLESPVFDSLSPRPAKKPASEDGIGQIFSPGTYTFRFSSNLPDVLPRSFKEKPGKVPFFFPTGGGLPRSLGEDGCEIRYTASASMEAAPAPVTEGNTSASSAVAPGQTVFANTHVDFTVLETFNFSAYGAGELAISREDHKGFIFGGKGEAFMRVTVNSCVFEAGGVVSVTVAIENKSMKRIEYIGVRLKRMVTFDSQQHSITRDAVVIDMRIPNSAVPAGQGLSNGLNFNLPPSLFGSVNGGAFIRVAYWLEVFVEVSMASNLVVPVPIRILDLVPSRPLGPAVPIPLPAVVPKLEEEKSGQYAKSGFTIGDDADVPTAEPVHGDKSSSSASATASAAAGAGAQASASTESHGSGSAGGAEGAASASEPTGESETAQAKAGSQVDAEGQKDTSDTPAQPGSKEKDAIDQASSDMENVSLDD
eukprot:Rmarinus@m.7617